jgi:hypothetical protein
MILASMILDPRTKRLGTLPDDPVPLRARARRYFKKLVKSELVLIRRERAALVVEFNQLYKMGTTSTMTMTNPSSGEVNHIRDRDL